MQTRPVPHALGAWCMVCVVPPSRQALLRSPMTHLVHRLSSSAATIVKRAFWVGGLAGFAAAFAAGIGPLVQSAKLGLALVFAALVLSRLANRLLPAVHRSRPWSSMTEDELEEIGPAATAAVVIQLAGGALALGLLGWIAAAAILLLTKLA